LWVSGDTGVVGVERISSNAIDMCRVTLDTGKLADYTP